VVTSTLVLEGQGRLADYVGGYTDWVRQRPNALFNAESAAPAKASPSPVQTAGVVAEPKRKLSYKDQRELELLPARIEKLEAEIASRAASMNEPKFYQQDSAAILAFNEASAKLQEELEHAYQRWNELDA
jgi:ATP-binding cassette subfamily F protein uup